MKANNTLATQEKPSEKKLTISEAFAMPNISQMLARTLKDQRVITRFTTSIVAAVSLNPQLGKCQPTSIISCGLQGEALKLSPSPSFGHYYMVPYDDNNDGKTYARFQIGAKGLKQLAVRTGEYKRIVVESVRTGEFKGLDPETGAPIVRFMIDPDDRRKATVIGYYAAFTLNNGYSNSVYFSYDYTLEWADRYSPSFSLEIFNKWKRGEELTGSERKAVKGKWYTDTDAMGEKTVIRRLFLAGDAPLSDELRTALENDNEAGEPFERKTPIDVTADDGEETPQTQQTPQKAQEQAKSEKDKSVQAKKESAKFAAETDEAAQTDFFSGAEE